MSLNKKAIEAYLNNHPEKDISALVTRIIKATSCAQSCYQALIDNPQYPKMLEFAQKKGSMKSVHDMMFQQLGSMHGLRCKENSQRKRQRPS